MTLRRLFRRFLPRRNHPLLDAEAMPAPRDAELRARYAAAVAGEGDLFVTQRFEEGLRWREVVSHFVKPDARRGSAVSRILDVGGGNGAIELAFSGQPSSFVVSVDALWNATAASLGVRRVLADAAALPFRGETFDVVLCLETIEHVPDPRAVAAEIARVASAEAIVPASLQRRIAARHGFHGPHHFVDRIYSSVGQLRRVFRELSHESTLARSRAPGRWFWDAIVFRKR